MVDLVRSADLPLGAGAPVDRVLGNHLPQCGERPTPGMAWANHFAIPPQKATP